MRNGSLRSGWQPVHAVRIWKYALKPRPPFQVLVMSEESPLGREAIETAYPLEQLVQVDVRVFFYLEDRERTLDSPTEKLMQRDASYVTRRTDPVHCGRGGVASCLPV